MAEVSRTGTPTPSNPLAVQQHSITGLHAGEALAGGDAVYINPADGLVYKASGAAADDAADCVGFVAKVASAGAACTILQAGVHLGYGANVGGAASAPGLLYLSATVPGGLSDTATTGGTDPVARVLDADGRIVILAI